MTSMRRAACLFLLLWTGCSPSIRAQSDACRTPVLTVSAPPLGFNILSICEVESEHAFLIGCSDGWVRKINLSSGAIQGIYKTNTVGAPVWTVSMSDDGRLAATGFDNYVVTWNRRSGKLQRSITAAESGVRDARFLPGSHDLVVTGVGDPFPHSHFGHYTVALWNADSGARLYKAELPDRACCLDVSRDGKFVAIGCTAGALVLADPRTGHCRTYNTGAVALTSVAFSPDSSAVAAVSPGRCWVLPVSLAAVAASWTTAGDMEDMAYSPDGKVVAVRTHDPNEPLDAVASHPFSQDAITVWDPTTGMEIGRLGTGRRFQLGPVFTPHGNALYAIDLDNSGTHDTFALYNIACELKN